MKKIMVGVLLVVAGAAQATLLVEESFDYDIGSASYTWKGGTGFVSNAWSRHDTGATLTNGLTLGSMQVSGGSAHLQFTAGSGFSSSALERQLDTSSVTSGDLWMAYLFKFDTARSTIPGDEAMEVRPGAGSIRTKVDENSSAIGVRYGSAWSSTVDSAVKDGTTLLFVSKFSDLGATGGNSARGWGMTASEYDSMMANGGLSESNLDTYAGIQITKAHADNVTMAGNVTLQFLPFGRNNSTPSFYVDELRLGTTLNDVVAKMDPNIPVEVDSSILGLSYLPGGLMEMVVNSSFPARSYLRSTTNLVEGNWENVAHSDDGVNDFVLTNLSYSTVSGTNRIIYLQADTAQKFFGIGE